MEEKEATKRPRRKRLWIAAIVITLVVIVIVLATTLSLLLNNNSSGNSNSSSSSGSSKPKASEKPYWPGWDGIRHFVVFGDSMTSVNFDWNSTQPSTSNPIGNPDFPGLTSSIGPNWVGYMTATYNDSFIETVDLGGGGATVDGSILHSVFPTERSFQEQVLDDFIPTYTQKGKSQFNQKETLYASFFGLNDVRDSYFSGLGSVPQEVIRKYAALLGDLYKTGARNFLVLKLTSFQRAPVFMNNASAVSEVKYLVDKYNTDLSEAVAEFAKENSDAAVFVYDLYPLFNQLLDDPCSYDVTCPLKNTTTFCPAYENERMNENLFRSECEFSINKYFWINAIHPIYRVHDAMAKAIVAYIKS